jgi:hypothetical protein
MKALAIRSFAMLLISCIALPALAHHSAAPHFDLSREIRIAGVVSRFEFVNPHAYVYFMVPAAGGAQQSWRCELAARATLSRLGWTPTTFVIGQKLTFKGAPAWREENVCTLNSFVREDGVEIDAHANLLSGGRGPAPLSVVQTITAKPVAASQSPTPDADARLAGLWVPRDQGGPGGRGARGPGGRGDGPPPAGGRGGMPQATAVGRAAAREYDQRFDDPAVHCSPANIIFGWMHDQNVNEIRVAAREVTLKYGYMDLVRTIHLDLMEHPKSIQAEVAGHSIGHWENGVLVVDTVGFAAGVLVPMAGLMHSARMHVVERFAVDATGNTLTRSYEVEDPLYLAAPYNGSDVVLRSSEAATPYNCVELSGRNNQRAP